MPGLSDVLSFATKGIGTTAGVALKVAPLAIGAGIAAQIGEKLGFWNIDDNTAIGGALAWGDRKVSGLFNGAIDYLGGHSNTDGNGKPLTEESKAALAEANKIENYVDLEAFKKKYTDTQGFDVNKFEAIALDENGAKQFLIRENGQDVYLNKEELALKSEDAQKQAKLVVGYKQKLDENDPSKGYVKESDGSDKIYYAELDLTDDSKWKKKGLLDKLGTIAENGMDKIGDMMEGIMPGLTGKGKAVVGFGAVLAGLGLAGKGPGMKGLGIGAIILAAVAYMSGDKEGGFLERLSSGFTNLGEQFGLVKGDDHTEALKEARGAVVTVQAQLNIHKAELAKNYLVERQPGFKEEVEKYEQQVKATTHFREVLENSVRDTNIDAGERKQLEKNYANLFPVKGDGALAKTSDGKEYVAVTGASALAAEIAKNNPDAVAKMRADITRYATAPGVELPKYTDKEVVELVIMQVRMEQTVAAKTAELQKMQESIKKQETALIDGKTADNKDLVIDPKDLLAYDKFRQDIRSLDAAAKPLLETAERNLNTIEAKAEFEARKENYMKIGMKLTEAKQLAAQDVGNIQHAKDYAKATTIEGFEDRMDVMVKTAEAYSEVKGAKRRETTDAFEDTKKFDKNLEELKQLGEGIAPSAKLINTLTDAQQLMVAAKTGLSTLKDEEYKKIVGADSDGTFVGGIRTFELAGKNITASSDKDFREQLNKIFQEAEQEIAASTAGKIKNQTRDGYGRKDNDPEYAANREWMGLLDAASAFKTGGVQQGNASYTNTGSIDPAVANSQERQ